MCVEGLPNLQSFPRGPDFDKYIGEGTMCSTRLLFDLRQFGL